MTITNIGHFTLREYLLAAVTRTLIAGFLVRLSQDHLFAFRQQGEFIDDGGELLFETHGSALFMRMHGYRHFNTGGREEFHTWAEADNRAGWAQLTIKPIIDEMDDATVEMVHSALVFAATMSSDTVKIALSKGIRLPNTLIPTTPIGLCS